MTWLEVTTVWETTKILENIYACNCDEGENHFYMSSKKNSSLQNLKCFIGLVLLSKNHYIWRRLFHKIIKIKIKLPRNTYQSPSIQCRWWCKYRFRKELCLTEMFKNITKVLRHKVLWLNQGEKLCIKLWTVIALKIMRFYCWISWQPQEKSQHSFQCI